ADRQAGPGGRRLDHPRGDREVDRHEQRVGGVVPVHLAREEHLLRPLRDDAQGGIDHEGDGVGRRRLPGEQQAGHRRVAHAVRGCVPLDRGHQSGQLVRCHVRPPGRSASFAPVSLSAAGDRVHGHSHRFWTIRQELWTIGLPPHRGSGLSCMVTHYPRPHSGWSSAHAAVTDTGPAPTSGVSPVKQFAWCLALVLPCAPAFAADPKESFDWPQWQGPDRTAVSKEKGLLQEWPKDGPPLAWKATGIGEGMGGVAVSRGRVYTTGDSDGSASLFALNESDGKQAWKAKVGRAGKYGNVF